MDKVWVVGLLSVLVCGVGFPQGGGVGGGGPLWGLLLFDFAELNSALTGVGFPSLPEGMVISGGGGRGGVIDGLVLGGMGFGGTQEVREGERAATFDFGCGLFTLEHALGLGPQALVGLGVGLGGGAASLELRSRWPEDFQDALAAPTLTRLESSFFSALVYLRFQVQPWDWLGMEAWAGYLVGLPVLWQEGGRDLSGPQFSLQAPMFALSVAFGGMEMAVEEELPG